MARKRRLNDTQILELLTARKTKGAAFTNISLEAYQSLRDDVHNGAQALLFTNRIAFFKKYSIYLYDVMQ